MKRPGKKRLSVDLDIEMHEELKRVANKRYMKITGLIKEAIIQRLAWEKKYE